MPEKEVDRRTEIILKETGGIITEYEAGITGIFNAMDEYMKERCLELLEYMAKNDVDCEMLGDDETDAVQAFFYYKGEWIKKEQLFENFL